MRPHVLINTYLNLTISGLPELGMAQRSVQRRFSSVSQTQLFQPCVRFQSQGGQV